VISRRTFNRIAIGGVLATAFLPHRAGSRERGEGGVRYIAAYDTESPQCLKACRKIAEVHKRFEMPATFFVLGKRLKQNPTGYREVLDDPLFEIGSHTYSHKLLRNHPFCGRAAPPAKKRDEIFQGKAWVEKVFERPCLGLRPGCGFENGLRGAPDALALIEEAGFRYVSSQIWGPDYSLPAPLTQPFDYAADGYPSIWELPGHGWHENLLKNNNDLGPKKLVLWPPAIPEAIPDRFISTPEEEYAINRIFLERAVSQKNCFVSLIWHPWSLELFDPEMKMLELTFAGVRELGLTPCTYADLFREVAGG
jgi:peptidoglycan/xylan/chitin deacetylase (PgdA/CDA1 family)